MMETEILNGNAMVNGDSISNLLITPNDDEVVVNGNILPPSTITNNNLHGDRIKRKAKRIINNLSQESIESNRTVLNGNVNKLQKNSRKSRNGRGRGLPKKGGAGGKGTWGAPGIEILEERSLSDVHDPNYDSDSQDNYIVESIEPELNVEEIHRTVEPILQEYFENGDTHEVVLSLEELNLGSKRHEVLVLTVSLAMDRKPSHREMTSVLISDLYNRCLSIQNIAQGFSSLLKDLPDLTIDIPDAPTILGNFMARAVADDCLPPKFLTSYKGKVECSMARLALDRAEVLLSMKHGLVRLDNVWGVGGGIRPVKYLIKKMVLLLKEYLSSGDIPEATRCLQELEVPHFNHELVYEGAVMVLEDSQERTAELVCKLLNSLFRSFIITPDQMRNGFQRVFDNMPDICLDVPAAYGLLERFLNLCHKAGFVSDAIMKKMPSRGRKRFVSEGDGGRIKESTLT